MTNKTCRSCKGALKPQLVTRFENVNGRWLIIENVPALVCDQCGERYYTPDAHDLVVRIIHEGQPVRTETINVYDAEVS